MVLAQPGGQDFAFLTDNRYMRLAAVLVLIAAVSCSSPPADFAFPPAVDGWTLDAAAGESGAGGWQASYRNATGVVLTVRVEQPGMGAAFERVQKSRPEPGLMFFHHDSYFVTVRGDGVPNDVLNGFSAAFEKHLRR
jgi:hypothetical protein